MPLIGPSRSHDYVQQWGYFCTLSLWRQLSGIAPDMTARAWSVANQAVYIPIWLDLSIALSSIACQNGAVTASGVMQVGIYAPDSIGRPGAAIWRGIQKAQTTKQQLWSINDGGAPYDGKNIIPAGLNYLAAVLDNGTGTVVTQVLGDTAGKHVYLGNVWKQASAYPLPATATPDATPAALVVPVMTLVTYL